MVEVGSDLQSEVEEGADGQCGTKEIGNLERGQFGYASSRDHPDADAYIP